MGGASSDNTRCVDIEDCVVVVLLWVKIFFTRCILAGLVDGGLDHTPAATGIIARLSGGVGLQADDHVVVPQM